MRVLKKSEELVDNELYVVVCTGLRSEFNLIDKVGRCAKFRSVDFQKLVIDHKTFLYDYEGGDRVAIFDDACTDTVQIGG